MAGPIRKFGEYTPPTEWFNAPVDKDSPLGTANVFSYAASANYGRIASDFSLTIDAIHFHLMTDGSGGQYDLEVWRYRDSAFTRIATASLAGGGGDGGFANFTFANASARSLQAGDYIFMQASAKMTGNPVGFVDVHYRPVPIR